MNRQNHILKTIPVWGPQFRVAFEMNSKSYPEHGWGYLLQITNSSYSNEITHLGNRYLYIQRETERDREKKKDGQL